MTWYVDVLDPRAGVAFVTQRDADLKDLKDLNTTGNAPTFFIGPPSFMPEIVARRVGFARARQHRQQLGLFVGKQELPFDSLAAVVEFVRRVYLGGAAGDGQGENGGAAPPPQTPEGGETPPNLKDMLKKEEGDLASDPVAAWLTLAEDMRNKSKELTEKSSTSAGEMPNKPGKLTSSFLSPVAGLSSISSTATINKPVRRLARGALGVLRELFRRRPGSRALPAHRFLWLTSLDRFAASITRMGLWSLMREELERNGALEAWITLLKAQFRDSELEDEIHLLLFHGSYRRRYWSCLLSSISFVTDPFEELAMLPVPPHTVIFTNMEFDKQNLQSLLSVAVAMPNQLFDQSPLGEERAELALFAAACLNLSSEPLPFLERRDDVIIYFAGQLVDRAHAWMAQNFPRMVYAEEIESLIIKTPKIPA